MTLNDITIKTRRLLADDEYDADVIADAANYFINEIYNNTRTRRMEASAELTASAGDVTLPFPSDLNVRIDLYVTVPSVYDYTDYYMEYGDFMRSFPSFASSAPAQAGKWTDFNNMIRFSAPLKSDTTIQLDYVRRPKMMSSLASKAEIDDTYMELVARGTKARCLEIDEDYDYASEERSLLEPLLTTWIRNEARGGGKTGPTIMRSNRRRRNSEW